VFSRSLKIALAGALFLGLSAAAPTSASTDHGHLTFVTFQHSVMLPATSSSRRAPYRFELLPLPRSAWCAYPAAISVYPWRTPATSTVRTTNLIVVTLSEPCRMRCRRSPRGHFGRVQSRSFTPR
jgi:hypothetical protein